MKLSILSAVAFALTLSGTAFAADQPQPPSHQPEAKQQPQQQPQTGQSGQSQTGQSGQPQTGRSDQPGSTQDQEYQAELKKCADATDMQKCVDRVKKQFGQM
jgi:opacity protein-like surface antigen